jgi:Abnormal spindle-like microcephaly-assoc'd, ASPM-SPD-2-Hydin/Protein of unknown function (DUF1573)
MLETGAKSIHSNHLVKAAGALLLLASLVFLVGCQGFSSSKSAVNQQVQSGTLSLSSASLDFGSVTSGASKTLAVTASNTGSASITISSASISSQYFSLSAPTLPIAILAGQSAPITLVFTPKAAGAFSAAFSVTSNASNSSATLSLTGTGVASGQFALSPASENFGSVTVGSNQSVSETVTNTGGSSLTISQVGTSGTGFTVSGITAPVTLTAGQSATFSVTFTPQSAANASGSVTITSNAPSPTLTIPLSGTGVAPGAPGANPSSLAFGSVTLGSKQALSETVTNTGGSSVTISQVGISGTGFTVSGITAPVTLMAGQSATFSVTFTPQSAANASGSLTITSNTPSPNLTIPLSGTGVAPGALGSSPSSLAFGSVTVGSNRSASGTVTNTGGSSVIISQVGISGAGFTASGITAPVTLTAGQSATFTVTFVPASAGSVSGNLTVTSNAPNPTLTIPLSGTGLAPGALGSNPTILSFGSITVGSNRSVSETVTNTGGSSVIISQIGINGTGFGLSGITAPVTLTAGQSAAFSVTFTPQSAANASGSVTVTSNATNPTLTIPLSGTGLAPGALGSSPTSLSFGSITVGSNQSASETVTNTGGSSVTISQIGINGTGFGLSGINAPVTLTAGQSAAFSVTFTPQSAANASGSVTVTSNATNPTLTIPLSGTGLTPGALGSSPTSLSFGSVTVGSNRSASETVTNTGGSSVIISQVGISGTGFTVSGITAPVTLTAGQSTAFSVTFTPQSAANASGSVTVTSNATNPTLTIPLSGTGLAPGALGPNPTSLNFGSVTVGSNQSASETVTNTGGSSVTISQAGISGTGFTVSGISAPVTLTAGQSATFTVTFAPASAGSVSGNLTVTSNAPNPTLTIPLSGTGLAPGALGSNPTSLSFGSVTVGSNQSASETVTNTGGSSVTISQVGISGTGFTVSGITAPVTLTAGQSAAFSVTFTPQSAATASGSVTVTSNAPSPTLTIPLSGTGLAPGALGPNPTSLNFGSVTVGSNQSVSETVTNTGGSSVTISQVGINGTGFTVSGTTVPVTLTAGQSATFSVTFTPQSAATASGSVTVTSNATNPTLTIPLSGTGTAAAGQLTITPTTLGLGSVVVGTSGTASGSLTASSTNVTVTAASSSNSAFSMSGLSLPVTIPAGQSASFTVTFSPQASGAASATLTFASSAQPAATTETLTGTGTAAPTYTVNLSWNASTSSDVSGYNIYRAVYTTSCESFSKINSALNTSTLYADSVVADGTSYCYATTAVNSSNEESGYSNTVSNIQIPAP